MSHQKKIWAVKHSKKAISRQTSILLLRNGQSPMLCVDRNYLIIWQLSLFLTKKDGKISTLTTLLEKGDPDKSIFTYAYNYVDICYYTKSKRALYKFFFLFYTKFFILLPLIDTVYVVKVWKVCIIQYLISVKCVHLCVRKPLKCISK